MSLLLNLRYLFKPFKWEKHWESVISYSEKFVDADEAVLDALMKSAEKRLEAVMQTRRLIGAKSLQLLIFLATGEAGLIGYIVAGSYSQGRSALLMLACGLMVIIGFLTGLAIPSILNQPYLMMKEWKRGLDVLAFKNLQLASLCKMSDEIERRSVRETLYFSGALAASCLLALAVLIVNVHAS